MPTSNTKGLRVLETLTEDVKEIRADVNQIKLDQAHNKDVNELKIEVGILKTKVWILYMVIGTLGVESVGVLIYLIQQWVEKR